MHSTLDFRHLAPTAPDTLRAFPYVDEDPFVLHECPHLYVCGNQAAYGERLVTGVRQAVKLVSVPAFREHRGLVLVDTATLQTYLVTLDVSQGIKPERDTAQHIVRESGAVSSM